MVEWPTFKYETSKTYPKSNKPRERHTQLQDASMSASLAALGAEVQAFRRSFVAKHGRKPELNDLRAHPRAYNVYLQYARAKATASASTVCSLGVLCLSLVAHCKRPPPRHRPLVPLVVQHKPWHPLVNVPGVRRVVAAVW